MAMNAMLTLIDQMDGFQHRLSNYGQTVRADFVHGVFRRVMIPVGMRHGVRAIVDVDDVGTGNTALDEGQMIVLYRVVGRKEIGLIAFFLRCIRNQIE